MLLFGEVLRVYEGSEYQGRKPWVAEVLDRTGERAVSFNLDLKEGQRGSIANKVGSNVLFDFTLISGRNEKGRYTLYVDAQEVSADLLKRVSSGVVSAVGVR